eukprot:CAMPEP_0175168152 /NCGR_PEP_ID=MMETSP0087-20121206/28788_1 /TAXON_ID=136419 /ORGANISM="Unknown Unknown, Strain D1" /LENGTH=137 /DNA_ID=CAMNT_0016458219 /DNA_START=5 /DNA_END=415 /DNA_ORIENTATION=+
MRLLQLVIATPEEYLSAVLWHKQTKFPLLARQIKSVDNHTIAKAFFAPEAEGPQYNETEKAREQDTGEDWIDLDGKEMQVAGPLLAHFQGSPNSVQSRHEARQSVDQSERRKGRLVIHVGSSRLVPKLDAAIPSKVR